MPAYEQILFPFVTVVRSDPLADCVRQSHCKQPRQVKNHHFSEFLRRIDIGGGDDPYFAEVDHRFRGCGSRISAVTSPIGL